MIMMMIIVHEIEGLLCLFDDVTQINFRFRFLVKWPHPYGVLHLPTKFGVDTFVQSGDIDIFQNSIWRSPPSWIFIICHNTA